MEVFERWTAWPEEPRRPIFGPWLQRVSQAFRDRVDRLLRELSRRLG
jgi:hypothetical protein